MMKWILLLNRAEKSSLLKLRAADALPIKGFRLFPDISIHIAVLLSGQEAFHLKIFFPQILHAFSCDIILTRYFTL